MTEVRFSGTGYESAKADLNALSDTIKIIAADRAVNEFGEHALHNPTEIEVTPAIIEEPLFAVRAWHETDSVNKVGVFQHISFTLKLLKNEQGIYIQSDDENTYKLTRQDADRFINIGKFAMVKAALPDASLNPN